MKPSTTKENDIVKEFTKNKRLHYVIWRDAEFSKMEDYIPFVVAADFDERICFEKFLSHLDEDWNYHGSNSNLDHNKWYGCSDCNVCGNEDNKIEWNKDEFFEFVLDIDHYCYLCSVFIFGCITL